MNAPRHSAWAFFHKGGTMNKKAMIKAYESVYKDTQGLRSYRWGDRASDFLTSYYGLTRLEADAVAGSLDRFTTLDEFVALFNEGSTAPETVSPEIQKIEAAMADAEETAIDSLARYKFFMFGYWAAQWVNLNKLLPKPKPNPFAGFVQMARQTKGANQPEKGGN